MTRSTLAASTSRRSAVQVTVLVGAGARSCSACSASMRREPCSPTGGRCSWRAWRCRSFSPGTSSTCHRRRPRRSTPVSRRAVGWCRSWSPARDHCRRPGTSGNDCCSFWRAGIAARLIWLAIGAYGLRRLRRRASPLDPLPESVRRAPGARRPVRARYLCLGSRVRSDHIRPAPSRRLCFRPASRDDAGARAGGDRVSRAAARAAARLAVRDPRGGRRARSCGSIRPSGG